MQALALSEAFSAALYAPLGRFVNGVTKSLVSFKFTRSCASIHLRLVAAPLAAVGPLSEMVLKNLAMSHGGWEYCHEVSERL